ncbi:hypothetical protein F9L16_21870 [Agarivorans sp. B2Z047]|uniref:hypothetical protein n=1 Tax=Agarivorans sp. B2Z047 TaxID=2652721 RepID=UPI00128D9D58|nr:hypothetical protein [Agarivorans sp. B2Z047]MPW31627.1 hypothetical protein [Agarivorans sp. B2Z047]UQN42413.1 hypothetical protein LQZ07_21960 [Agarivorans sp. B2Z047]
MSSFVDNLSPKEWEAFCEIMLRQHYGAKNFWSVPDEDGGDLGLEFYTIDGTLFQCYCPDKGVDMASYKRKVQKKIREDLKKLKTYENKIAKMIDDVTVHQWILLTPEFKSKDLIGYCNTKKRAVIAENISYINNDEFLVKIETADSYPDGKLYAQGVYNKAIDIPLHSISEVEKDAWKEGNTEFSGNVVRKSVALMGERSEGFQDEVFTKYIQIEKFLDQLREGHPDLYEMIEDTARAQLENMREDVFFSTKDKGFVKSIVDGNKSAFSKHSEFMSEKNVQSLSFGYLSKWLAQCYMDFES